MSCDPCESPVIVNIPGAQGADGLDGTDGADGSNAFTFLTAASVVPAELATVIVTVMDSTWATVGQNVSMQFAGEYEVMSKPSSTLLTLKNLKDTPTLAYMTNAPPATPIPNGAQISPSGKQGIPGVVPAGSAPATATYITQVPQGGLGGQALSTVATGLLKSQNGTGIISHAVPGTDYLDPTTGVEVADIGVTVQPLNANLTALSALTGAADRLSYFTGPGAMSLIALSAFIRTLLDDANAGAARLTLGVRYGLLGVGTGLNLNGAAPGDLSPITINSAKYIVDRVLATDASVSLTTATLGLFGSAGGGVPVICVDQSLATLTGPTKQKALTISGSGATDIITDLILFPRLGTAQGAAATCSLWVFGYDLT